MSKRPVQQIQSSSAGLKESAPFNEAIGLYKVGGVPFIISAILFFLKYLLDLATGEPPSTGGEILTWVSSEKLLLDINNEVLFFAVGFLVPSVIALYSSLVSTDKTKAAVGCGLIAVALPTIAVLDIVHGRLIYPVYDLRISDPAIAEFAVAIFYGGLHAVSIMFGIATIILSLTMRRGIYGMKVAYLGFATGVFDIIGSDPWLIGPILVLISQILFAAWFIAIGWRLYTTASVGAGPVQGPNAQSFG